MPLAEWLASGWLTGHPTSRDEVAGLLALIERDLAQSQTPSLVADWRFNIAYNSALQAATLALAACGYRVSREDSHKHAIETLSWTVGVAQPLVSQLQVARRKRNLGHYERAGLISEQEAREMHDLAVALRDTVLAWLRAERPGLLA